MKLSVSVDQTLWLLASHKAGTKSPSKVVQIALEAYVGTDRPNIEEIIKAGLEALGYNKEAE